MATMAAEVTSFLTSYDDAAPDFHCRAVYCPYLFADISMGTFVQILLDKKERDGLVVGSCSSSSAIPSEERDAMEAVSNPKEGCGWLKVVLMRHTSEPNISSSEKFVPLRMPDVMSIPECVLTLEYRWTQSDSVKDFLWVFWPESANARLVAGMTNGRVIRYQLDSGSDAVHLLAEDACLAFPCMYSVYKSMYVDCYPMRVFDTIKSIRVRILAILNRRAQTQGSEFAVNRQMPLMQMSADTWAYIRRRMLKSGIPQLDDHLSKRVVGDLRGHDLSYHTIRLQLEWEHFTIDSVSMLKKFQGLVGCHIWAGSRKKRPKVDLPPKTIGINDAWNVIEPRPDTVTEGEVGFRDSTFMVEEDGTPTQVISRWGKYDLLFDRVTSTFKIWIEYRKVSTLNHSGINDIFKANQIAPTGAAFRDNWDTDVRVNVGMTLMYTDTDGSYYLEIVAADESEVQCKVLQAKDDCCPVGTVLIIDDVEKVRTIIKSKLQKTVNS
jgi:hypothetical protein